jgi:hypothetical protein
MLLHSGGISFLLIFKRCIAIETFIWGKLNITT